MKIHLSSSEVLVAATVGITRHISALQRGRADRHGYDGEGWHIHIEGACGELAVAKALGIHWTAPINTFKSGSDVGGAQVRTRSKDEWDLIIRPDDRDTDTFILVTGQCPNYNVVGKIIARDGKRDEFWKAHGGRPSAWFVPQSALEPI